MTTVAPTGLTSYAAGKRCVDQLEDVDPGTGLPRLYTLDEVARATGLSARALADNARAGKFDHVRLCGKRYMTRGQVVKMIEASTRISVDTEKAQAREEARGRTAQRLARRLARG